MNQTDFDRLASEIVSQFPARAKQTRDNSNLIGWFVNEVAKQAGKPKATVAERRHKILPSVEAAIRRVR
jgi:hypothetical protein